MQTFHSSKKLAFAICLLITACGQRGPLFLPDKSAGPPQAQNPEAADKQPPPEDEDDTGP